MSNSGGFSAPPPPPPPPSAGGGDQLPQRKLGDILSAAFDVYKANFVKLITIVAIIVVPLTFISNFLVGVVFKPKTSTLTVGGQQVTTVTVARSFAGAIGVLLLGALIGIIISAILQAALVRAAAAASLGEPVDTSESFSYGFRRLWSVLWISLLVGLVVGGIAIVIVALGILIKPLAILFVLAAFVWIVFSETQLFSTIPSLVVENRRGTKAMSRSWELVKGHFWHVLGTIFVAYVIAGVIGGILGAFGGSAWVLRWVFSAIAQIITAPFVALVSVVLYLDLRARKESLTADQLRADLARSD
jgi:hypothetical protein